jgi:hypothetical protein
LREKEYAGDLDRRKKMEEDSKIREELIKKLEDEAI